MYILASDRNGTLYIGVTSDLIKRTWQHQQDATGFTAVTVVGPEAPLVAGVVDRFRREGKIVGRREFFWATYSGWGSRTTVRPPVRGRSPRRRASPPARP